MAITAELAHVRVAVGVLFHPNARDKVLIAKRPQGKELAGLWEFPGGKIEAGETDEAALRREFAEEIGIDVIACHRFLEVEEHYPNLHRKVSLQVFIIDEYRKQPLGLEGQALLWCKITELEDYDFPSANHTIIKKIQNSLHELI